MVEKVEQGQVQEKKKGFFGQNEGILLISSNYMEKQQIEDGLNREITRITSVDELIRSFSQLATGNGVRASIILTSEIPKDIRAGIESVVEFIEVAEVPSFEIGVGKTIKGAYRFGTIHDFLSFARNNKRKEQISGVKNDEQRTILEELQLETDSQKEKIELLEQEKEDLEKQYKEIQGKCTTLETQIEQVYKVQTEDAKNEVIELEDRLESITRLHDIEKRKSASYQAEKDDALGQLTELKLTVQSLKEGLREKQGEIRKLERTIERYKIHLEKVKQEKEKILRSRVDSEEHVLLSNELEGQRKEVDRLEKLVAKQEIRIRSIKYDKELLQEEIQFLRDGNYNIENTGRTTKLDMYKFEKTDLIYIKVFDELPYLRLATKMFFDKMSDKYDGRSHLMILRYDDGMDDHYLDGVPIWSKIKDVPASDRIFRIFPHPAMFTKADEWEKPVDLLIVVDFIKNNKYYLTSQAKERFMTVVRRETDMDKYNLKGSPITIDGKSVFDIQHDPRISGSGVKENRHRMLSNKVDKWIHNIE